MVEKILVEVWFLEGIRQRPPFGDVYRPHLIVEGKADDSDYCGIQFDYFSEKPFGEHFQCSAQLIYKNYGVDYSAFLQGTCFDIKEGRRTVGKGIVIENNN